MNSAEWKYERERLKLVLAEIESEIHHYENQSHHSWEKLQDELASYWEARSGTDEAQSVAAVGRQRQIHALTHQKKIKLSRMADNPYFGRIDFLEKSSPAMTTHPEQIYIGIGTLIKANSGQILIYDWRAPVCSMFYDYELGEAEYPSPAGLIHGELQLKRQYKITNSQLEYMFDCDLKIDDELLQEILSQSVDEKMRTIVTSIQREQNRIIRDENHRLLVVQGAAGSGKTSIALHRVAYLLYKDRETITSQNILIFSPNRVFSDYISDVLPELGETNTPQLTFEDLIQKFKVRLPQGSWLESWAEQLEYLVTAPDNEAYRTIAAGIRLKSSPIFAEIFKNYLAYQEQNLFSFFPEISYEKRLIFSQNEWQNLWGNLSYLPPAQRLRQIRRRISNKLKPLIKELRSREEAAIAATGEEVNETTIKAMARLAVWLKLRPLREQIEELTTIDILAIYRQLYEDPEIVTKLTPNGQTPDHWETICQLTLERLKGYSIPYEDVIAILYLQGCFEGFPGDNNIRHLVIDEAQDYSVLQYEIIKQIFPKPTFTILGDLDQTVHPWFSITDFSQMTSIFGIEEAASIKLLKSYRSTSEIMAFCRALLPKDQNYPEITHLNRPGSKPEIIKVLSTNDYWDAIAQNILKLNENYRSIAVICKSAKDSREAYENLKNKVNINLVTKEQTFFRQGITAIPVYLAKGLEFDAVIVDRVSADKYYRLWESHLLYVACTRALHQLKLVWVDRPSPLLPMVSPDLFTSNDKE